jgi:hypothetical protein
MGMTTPDLLRALIESPELATVGSPKERAAFIGLNLERRTVREASKLAGVSKSGVQSLAQLFQAKLRKRIQKVQAVRPEFWSVPFRKAYRELADAIEPDYESSHKVGHVDMGHLSNEDLAEAFGHHSARGGDEE